MRKTDEQLARPSRCLLKDTRLGGRRSWGKTDEEHLDLGANIWRPGTGGRAESPVTAVVSGAFLLGVAGSSWGLFAMVGAPVIGARAPGR